MTFLHRRFRNCFHLTTLCALALMVTGCASLSPKPIPVDNGQDVPRYVKNLPKSKSGNMAQYKVFGKRYRTLDSAANFTETGTASWYGKKFHGRKTSSGATYDMYAMTAAHKHLPLPTYVRVTNLENNKSVIVLVNDRGPFVGSRVIDLSFAAAMEIEMAEQGTAKVRVDALSTHFMDGELPPANANIAQADEQALTQEPVMPSVVEPQIAAVPLQEPILGLKSAELETESPTDTASLADPVSDISAVAESSIEPVIAAPAAALASDTTLVAAETMQRGVQVDTSEDGFVEMSSLDAAPVIAEPEAVQAMVIKKGPKVVDAPGPGAGNVFIQLGAFSQQINAQLMVDRVADQVGLPAFVERDSSRSLYRVKMGPFKKGQQLESTLIELESVGIESYTLLASKR